MRGLSLRFSTRRSLCLIFLRTLGSHSCTKEFAEPLSQEVYTDIETNHSLKGTMATGLYGFDLLKSPKGFRKFVQEAIEKSEDLIASVEKLPPSEETIRAMDDISNTICMVVDSAEFCRSTHPNREYVEEATKASMKIYEYLHHLNTNHLLYDAVIKSEKHGLFNTEEAQRAAQALRIDFEKGGIHLSKEKLERVNQLNLAITELGRELGSMHI
eukprot:TRINITY_DN8297_c0_g1_i1.p1 TRINITY_DN8297_c0_g1~~TRINITY_DN8297_c0_g1_i1.p1  ORF type:complete len:214 (-),score=29.73 TRINITY_DN8297_c0_g1_i1:69-710(-)